MENLPSSALLNKPFSAIRSFEVALLLIKDRQKLKRGQIGQKDTKNSSAGPIACSSVFYSSLVGNSFPCSYCYEEVSFNFRFVFLSVLRCSDSSGSAKN